MEKVYLHACDRVYLGRVTVFADDASLEPQWETMAVWLYYRLYYSRCGEFRWTVRVTVRERY